MLQDQAGWVAVGALVLVLLLAWLITAAAAGDSTWGPSGGSRGRRRPPRQHFRPKASAEPVRRRRAAVVVNPTKFDDEDSVRERITSECLGAGWAEPLWLRTTVEDPGTGQAKTALDQGVDLVCALGGDGTVRAVAAALVESDTPMGLLPGGTGNLLARNLQLPVDSLEEALQVALSGRNKRIDVGLINVVPEDQQEEPKDHIFLVMAGLGFDAAIMADAPEKLKKHIGWAAYSFAGLKNLRGPRFRIKVRIDDHPPFRRSVRTLVVGNCGKLTGGLVLLPEAQVDDGWLDAVLLSPKGLAGWVAVAARLVTRRHKGHQRVDHHRARILRVTADRAEAVQLDGDTIGQARGLTLKVDPGALLVRVG